MGQTEQYLKYAQAVLATLEFLTNHVAAAHGPGQVASDANNHLAAVTAAHADFVQSLAPPAGLAELAEQPAAPAAPESKPGW